MPIRPELINAGGMLSGVATYALVDYTMGSALWAETTDEEAIATLNIAINYVATAVEGDAICTTVLDRRNRRAATLRSEVHARERPPDGDRDRLVFDLPAQARGVDQSPAPRARTKSSSSGSLESSRSTGSPVHAHRSIETCSGPSAITRQIAPWSSQRSRISTGVGQRLSRFRRRIGREAA